MSNNAGQTDDAALRQACWQHVRALVEKHGWTLLAEAELVERVLGANQPEGGSSGLEQLVKNHYIMALYEACRQSVDTDRREQAYQELFRYLFRAAYKSNSTALGARNAFGLGLLMPQ